LRKTHPKITRLQESGSGAGYFADLCGDFAALCGFDILYYRQGREQRAKKRQGNACAVLAKEDEYENCFAVVNTKKASARAQTPSAKK